MRIKLYYDPYAVAWKRRAARIVASVSFILGTTKPDASNTGTLPGVDRTTYTGPTAIAGSSDPDNPLLIEHKNVGSLLTINSGYVRFYNCLFTGGPGTFNTGQVNCRPAGVQGVKFERCTFRPDDPSYFLNAVIGHHMTMFRCDVSRVVDGVGSYNQYGPRTDNFVHGNFFHELVRYTVDEDHSDGTHNDTIVQHQGGIGLSVIGNYASGWQFFENGDTPASPWHRSPQAVIVQENVAFGGVYYIGEIVISSNWIGAHQQGISLATRALASSVPYNAVVVNNRFEGNMRDWGGTYHYYPIRLTSQVTMNGIAYSTTTPALDVNGNAWTDDAVVVAPATPGAAIFVRCDAAT